MINEIFNKSEPRLKKCIVALKAELAKLRTGRAHPSLLEHIKIKYYGNDTPLSQVASITAEGPRMLVLTPWEKSLVPEIEKMIRSSDLGLNPVTAGSVIRVPMPALTEERRRDLVKVVREEAEKARVAIRNVRREVMNEFKELLKEKKIGEDEEHRAQARMQKLTDDYITEVDSVYMEKEKELMAI